MYHGVGQESRMYHGVGQESPVGLGEESPVRLGEESPVGRSLAQSSQWLYMCHWLVEESPPFEWLNRRLGQWSKLLNMYHWLWQSSRCLYMYHGVGVGLRQEGVGLPLR